MMLEVINEDELQKMFSETSFVLSRIDREFSSAKNYC